MIGHDGRGESENLGANAVRAGEVLTEIALVCSLSLYPNDFFDVILFLG